MKIALKAAALALAVGLIMALAAAAVLDGREYRAERATAAAAAACDEGKFQWQVLNDCTRLQGCAFGPADLSNVRDLLRNCKSKE